VSVGNCSNDREPEAISLAEANPLGAKLLEREEETVDRI
jgi:hypothetical protein